jgi:hypothetical protein
MYRIVGFTYIPVCSGVQDEADLSPPFASSCYVNLNIAPPPRYPVCKKWVIVKYTDFICQDKFWPHLKLDFGKARNGYGLCVTANWNRGGLSVSSRTGPQRRSVVLSLHS